MLKVGLGQDMHRLCQGGPLILGGLSIDAEVQAIAHSDGDALIHAIIDALVTPICGENIGSLFPDNDPRYRSVDSVSLLQAVRDRFLQGVSIHNMDCVIILDQPKLGPYLPAMSKRIASILGLESHQVSIKAKTSEKTAPDRIEARVVSLIEVK